MKVFSGIFILLSALLTLPVVGYAYNTEDSVQVDVTGSIKVSPCTVIWPASTYNLGLYLVADLNRYGAGGNTQSRPVLIHFINCPLGTRQVTVNFSGVPVSDSGYESLLFANNLTGTDATQDVGLQLFYSSAMEGIKPIGPGDENKSVALTVSDNQAELKFYARMYTMHGQATAGKFSSTVTMNVSYQ